MMLLKVALLLLLSLSSSECQKDKKKPKKNSNVFMKDPVSAKEYQRKLGAGFGTCFFKDMGIREKYETLEKLKRGLKDIKKRGFTNLRLRSMAANFGYPEYNRSDMDPRVPKFDNASMQMYLDELEKVVDLMVGEKMLPVISWIGKIALMRASPGDEDNFVNWWKLVAERLKSKSYAVSFNLITEISSRSKYTPGGIFQRENVDKFNRWMLRTVDAIRQTGKNNKKRIIIIPTQQNARTQSWTYVSEELTKQPYLMREYHRFASGIIYEGRNAWQGNGTYAQVLKMEDEMRQLEESVLPVYWGAWAARAQPDRNLTQFERDSFAYHFTSELRRVGVPFSLNKIERYYDFKLNQWITDSWETGMNHFIDIVAGRAEV